MKKIVLSTLLGLFVCNVFAQIQVITDGSLKVNTYSTLHVTDMGTLGQANGFDFNPNTTSPGFLLEQNRSESSGFYCDGDFAVIYSPGDQSRLLRVYDEDGMVEKWYLDGSGNAFTISDERAKENIADIGNCLNELMMLKAKKYNYKKENHEGAKAEDDKYDPSQKQYFGFLAQDIEKLFPNIVSEDEKGNKFVSYSQLIPVIIQGISEQQAKIEQQEKEISQLKKHLDELDKKLVSLISGK
ncbi:MAG: tail fiber domain-containing protein [Draconibacterium sp.]